jgi:hypothetical protein
LTVLHVAQLDQNRRVLRKIQPGKVRSVDAGEQGVVIAPRDIAVRTPS